MRRTAVMMVAALLLASAPVSASMTPEEKDQCLLAAKGCAGEVDSIQKQMRKLQNEIKKGDRVYTKEELQTLKRKLVEVNELLRDLNKPGGGGGGGGGR